LKFSRERVFHRNKSPFEGASLLYKIFYKYRENYTTGRVFNQGAVIILCILFIKRNSFIFP
jgi:hypothetical protein